MKNKIFSLLSVTVLFLLTSIAEISADPSPPPSVTSGMNKIRSGAKEAGQAVAAKGKKAAVKAKDTVVGGAKKLGHTISEGATKIKSKIQEKKNAFQEKRLQEKIKKGKAAEEKLVQRTESTSSDPRPQQKTTTQSSSLSAEMKADLEKQGIEPGGATYIQGGEAYYKTKDGRQICSWSDRWGEWFCVPNAQ